MQIKVMRQILEWNEDVSSKVRSILQEKNIEGFFVSKFIKGQ